MFSKLWLRPVALGRQFIVNLVGRFRRPNLIGKALMFGCFFKETGRHRGLPRTAFYFGVPFFIYTIGVSVTSYAADSQIALAQPGRASKTLAGALTWHPLTTTGSEGPMYSIMHTAEPLKSDPDFAGMIVRCSAQMRLQIGLVLIVPLPPRAKPQVRLDLSNGQSREYSAKVLPLGTIAIINTEGEALARELTLASGELKIELQGDRSYSGVVPLQGLGEALASLRAHCS